MGEQNEPEQLLVARSNQLERRPEDVERAKVNIKEARVKNKERFDQIHQMQLRMIE